MGAHRLVFPDGLFVIDHGMVGAKKARLVSGRLHFSPAMYALVQGAEDPAELFRLFTAMGVDDKVARKLMNPAKK